MLYHKRIKEDQLQVPNASPEKKKKKKTSGCSGLGIRAWASGSSVRVRHFGFGATSCRTRLISKILHNLPVFFSINR